MAGPLARLGTSLQTAWKSAVAGARAGWGGGQGPVNWTQNGGIPVGWNWNFWQQNLRHLQGGESATVNACVNAYAMTLAQLPGGHFRRIAGGKGAAVPIPNSNVASILRDPNSYQTRSDFVLNLVTQLLFFGNAYAWAQRDGPAVESLHLMPPRSCEPYVEPDSRTVYYAVSDNPLAGEPTGLIPARDILHVRCRTHPQRPLQGITPITWAAMARDANTAISASQAAFFTNASQPSGFLSSKERLTPEQMATLRAAWEDRATGIAMGTVPILGGGMEFQQMGITSQDAQLVEAFGMTVADIARAFAVPLPIIGDLSNATFNNVENLIGLWLSQGLGFYVEHLEIALDKFFDLPASEYVEFDTDTLMRTAFRDRIEGLARAVSGGLYSPDEARGREGLPPAPGGWGEEPRLQAQVVPLSAAGEPAPSAPSAPAVNPDDNAADDDEPGEVERALLDLRGEVAAIRQTVELPPALPPDPVPLITEAVGEMRSAVATMAADAEMRAAALATNLCDQSEAIGGIGDQISALAARLDAVETALEPPPLDVSEAKAALDRITKGRRND